MNALPIRTMTTLIVAICISLLMTGRLYEMRGQHQIEVISRVDGLPSPVVQAISLEFKGVVADYLFLKTMSFMGEKIQRKEEPTREEWQSIHRMIGKITDLDNRFWDPYLFAEMMFAWQGGMLDEANSLLLKAAKYRPEDYRPYYFLGFNHFYFVQNSPLAAKYLRKAAQIPGAPLYVKGLAARMSIYGNQTKFGIFFLENLIKETQDQQTKLFLEKRLKVLKSIFYLEQKVIEYKKKFKSSPQTLEDLVEHKLIPSIPPDPYGGTFILLDNDRVYTTSELVEKKQRLPAQEK